MKQLTVNDLEGFGGLITLKGTNECLGDLMTFTGHGTFDPNYGQVPVSKEDADKHNAILDGMRLEGMDKNCEIGQGSFAYYGSPKGKITTFLGTVISTDYRLTGEKGMGIEFKRAGKVYRGKLSKNSDAFNFKRVK